MEEARPVAQPVNTEQTKPTLVKEVQMKPKKDKKGMMLNILIAVAVVVAGVGTGWLLSGKSLAKSSTPKVEKQEGVKVNDKEAGVTDESMFPDEAEGILEKGGIEGEGTHHLVREGGESKWVYMSSTVIDMTPFEGKTVHVWGQTLSGKKAGWLMDVGKIKVID